MRLIDADKIEFTANGCGHPNCKDVCEYTKDSGECCGWLVAHKREVDKIPTIDAVPVVHGHWKYGESFMLGKNRKCSVCGGIFPCNSAWVMSYCPDCGAKMDGDE